jgi:hypothetical protein
MICLTQATSLIRRAGSQIPNPAPATNPRKTLVTEHLARIATHSAFKSTNTDAQLNHVICSTQDGKSALVLPYGQQRDISVRPKWNVSD